MDNQVNPIQNYPQAQIIQSPVTDKTVKEIGDLIANTFLTVQRMKQENDIEIAKQEVEKAKVEKEITIIEIQSNEKLTLKLTNWEILYRVGILIICLVAVTLSIIFSPEKNLQLVSALLTLVGFVLGNSFKNQIFDSFKKKTRKKPQESEEDEDD